MTSLGRDGAGGGLLPVTGENCGVGVWGQRESVVNASGV